MVCGMDATIALAQPVTARLRSLQITGPAGRLEAVVNEGEAGAPFSALVCHPHPLGGGNLHNKVVYHAMKVLNEPRWGFRFPVLRFNFRGAGASEGIHDGNAERDDVRAAFEWLLGEFGRPVILAGFSFGAAMSIAAAQSSIHSSDNLSALIALGLPYRNDLQTYSYSELEALTVPKLFISGDRDQFMPARELTKTVAAAADPKKLVLIQDSDHFFTGHLAAMQNSLAAWLKEQIQ